MPKSDNPKNDEIVMLLGFILSKFNGLEEKINCIQHTICKNDDKKTLEAICEFEKSNFRNGIYE